MNEPTSADAALLERGRQVLARQPFSVLVGARLTRFEPGFAELTLPLRDDLLQQHGFAHGGVVSYCADNALTYAAGGSTQGSVMTSEFKINFVRPAVGDELIARASVVHAGRSQIVVRCDISVAKAGLEKLCAVAQGTVAVVSS